MASYMGFISYIHMPGYIIYSYHQVLVNWLYIITCKKCGYISSEKSPESKTKEMIRSHLGSHENCTRGHVNLVKVRA